MYEMKNLRAGKGSQTPVVKGEGSTYLIPADDVPDGIATGEKYKIIIEGICNTDNQGLIINVDRIYSEKVPIHTDPVQDSIESGLEIEKQNKETKPIPTNS